MRVETLFKLMLGSPTRSNYTITIVRNIQAISILEAKDRGIPHELVQMDQTKNQTIN